MRVSATLLKAATSFALEIMSLCVCDDGFYYVRVNNKKSSFNRAILHNDIHWKENEKKIARYFVYTREKRKDSVRRVFYDVFAGYECHFR